MSLDFILHKATPLKYLLFFALALTSIAFCADADKVFSERTVTMHFPSHDEAAKWKLASFKQWIDFITSPDWKLLQSSETDDFYFAIFRSDDCLIFWHSERKPRSQDSSSQSSMSITSKTDGRDVWKTSPPHRYACIDLHMEYPQGSFSGRYVGDVFKIKDDFHGTLVLSYSWSGQGWEKLHPAYLQEVTWGK
jgi:hypothetical protein